MNYWEFDFTLAPRIPWADIVVAQLAEIGFDSFVETELGVKAYISENELVQEQVDELLSEFKNNNEVALSFEQNFIPVQNWNATWERSFDPVYVGNDLSIVAPFHKDPLKTKIQITIEPKMSFGTGHHQTTRLMSRALLDLEKVPSRVLDMGSGTGVLAILAEKLGAKNIVAIDIEDWAYENALENAARNACQNIEVLLGDSKLLDGKEFDLILANINKNVLLSDMSVYTKSLNAKGLLFLSGFFTSDDEILVDCAKKTNLALVKSYSEENWSCLIFEKI
jgi:ribosomal protein L11 methyltransferase